MPDPIVPASVTATPGTAPVAAPPAAPVAAAAAPAAPAAPAATPGTLLTTPGDEKQGADPKGQPTAPADIKIKVPDGFAADQKAVDQFTAFAKEKGLSPEVAQGVFDQYVATAQATQRAGETQRAEMITQWGEESRREFGTAFDATIAQAKSALTRFGNPEITKMLTDTGLGNHKAVIKMLADIGGKISEDKLPAGTAPVGGERTEEQKLRAMYPKMYEEQKQ